MTEGLIYTQHTDRGEVERERERREERRGKEGGGVENREKRTRKKEIDRKHNYEKYFTEFTPTTDVRCTYMLI